MRLACISDTHGELEKVSIPACDILLHAGDVCPDVYHGLWTRHHPILCVDWMREQWLPWITPMLDDGWVRHVVLTWGNHDWTQMYGDTRDRQSSAWDFLPENVHVVVDREVNIDGVRIWGTPWSNEFNGWAWMKPREKLYRVYDQIPFGVDVILSHQPPRGYGGRVGFEELGSEELLYRVEHVTPQLVVCGHIHAGHGEYTLGSTKILNAAVVNEKYQVVHPATEVELR